MPNWSLFRLDALFVLIAVAGCERNVGTLLNERVIERGEIKILVQVYDIPWYGSERGVMFWCKSSHTLDGSSVKEAQHAKRNIEELGWKNWMRTNTVASNGGGDIVSRVTTERVHIVDDRFAYVDMGVGAVVLTFNGCESKVNLFRQQVYEAMPNPDTLVDHVSISRDIDGLAPPLFTGFNRRKVGGEGVYCFDINPVLQRVGDQGNQLCTKDNGARWHHSRVGG